MSADDRRPEGMRGAPRGRAAASNPTGRFERLSIELEEPGPERVETLYLRDDTRSIIARNDSPDVPFDASINPYRGCEHGCIYCYARLTHEYLGFSAGLDFETRILVKERAVELLRAELGSPKWQPQVLGISGVTDPYQPVERKLELTRGCLALLAACRNPVVIVTKNSLVARDIDLLAELAEYHAALVYVSITTLDVELMRRLEPRTSSIRASAASAPSRRWPPRGVPCGVLVAPDPAGAHRPRDPRAPAKRRPSTVRAGRATPCSGFPAPWPRSSRSGCAVHYAGRAARSVLATVCARSTVASLAHSLFE